MPKKGKGRGRGGGGQESGQQPSRGSQQSASGTSEAQGRKKEPSKQQQSFYQPPHQRGDGPGAAASSGQAPPRGSAGDAPPQQAWRKGQPGDARAQQAQAPRSGPPGDGRPQQVQAPKVVEKQEEMHQLPQKKEKVSPSEASAQSKKVAKAPQASVEEKAIVQHFADMTLAAQSKKGAFQMAKRPGRGKLGKPIALEVNYFQLQYKDILVYHYDIDICDVGKDNTTVGGSLMDEGLTAKEAIKKKVKHVEHQQKRSVGKKKCREIISAMVQSNQLRGYSPVYDGQKNIFTVKPLPIKDAKPYYVKLTINEKEKTYCVIIKPVMKSTGNNVISLEPLRELYNGRTREVPQEVMLVYETVMCHREPPLHQVQARSSFFSLTQEHSVDLENGLEIWFGYNQSVHLTERGPIIAINLAAKAFHKNIPIIQYASEILRTDVTRVAALRPYDMTALKKAFKNLRIQVTHQKHPRRYIIKDVTRESAKDLRKVFDDPNMTVAQYFATTYKPLKYGNLPCLHMRTTTDKTYLPMEFCVVCEGQPLIGKLDSNATSSMIRKAAIPPADRFFEIQKSANQVAREQGGIMKDYGLFMDVKLMQVNGRVLAVPAIEYYDKSKAQPDFRGVWRMDGKRFFVSRPVQKWILISFAQERFCPPDKLRKFANILMGSGRSCGLNMESPCDILIMTNRNSTAEALNRAVKAGVDFAIVVLSKRDNVHSYEEVKFIADFKLGLVTQCMDDAVVQRVVTKNDAQVTGNVCLKINLKLGGINHALLQRPSVFREPSIVIGADAIHWPRGYGYPSIAAVVGSLDPYPSRYTLACRLQENTDEKKISQEIILEMKDMVKDIFQKFTTVNKGRSPTKIIVFRDGVSYGQFQTVLDNEVYDIQQACMELYQKMLPITYIVVQKRHPTRFKPRNPRDGVGKMGNIPPGTVVDTDITHPSFYDYFLCSHEGIQGTSKAAHYTVLHDDNYLSADELQALTYHLCYTFGRCNRGVSVPAPVKYADIAAERAKKYADLFINLDTVSSADSDPTNRSLPPEVVEAITGMKSFPKNMFFI